MSLNKDQENKIIAEYDEFAQKPYSRRELLDFFLTKMKEQIEIAVREREIESEVCKHIARYYSNQEAGIINGFIRGAFVNLSTSPKE